MSTIDEMIRAFEQLDYEALGAQVIQDNAAQIEEVNRKQMLRGERADGSKITPKYRNEKYSRAKNAKNPQAGLGTPDLKFTGNFQRQIDVNVFGKSQVDFFSKDSKSEDLVAKYGEAIFGIQDTELPRLQSEVLNPDLIDLICLETGAKAE